MKVYACDPFLTIADVLRALDSGEITSRQLVEQLLARADQLDPSLGIYLSRFDDSSLEAAQQADSLRAAGKGGPLQGIPLAVKDVLSTSEGPTTAQSMVLKHGWEQHGDAVVVARLRAAGAIILGKTTTMEFGIGLPDPTMPFPLPRNPWDLQTWAGGSSSGTAAGIAAGLFPGGLGTDAGGSARQPAAFCGITSLKPTYGRIPRTGCIPVSDSLDHIALMAHTAEDCGILLSTVAGEDVSDPASLDHPSDNYVVNFNGDLDGLKIGIERRLFSRIGDVDPLLNQLFDEAVDHLLVAGAELLEVNLPNYEALLDVHHIISRSEAFAYHAPWLRGRWHDYGRSTRRALALGALLTAGDYVAAQNVRPKLLADVYKVFHGLNAVVMPTVTTGAPPIDEAASIAQSVRNSLTELWNLSGQPVAAAPMGFTASGLPLSIQVIGHAYEENMVLKIVDALQSRTEYHRVRPPLPPSEIPSGSCN
jgi:aspartyl-tRNA(Asn)/glutamyl-tRNA(Gln) amidotransferase subunit A